MKLPAILLVAAASTLTLHAVPALVDLGTLGGAYTQLPIGGGYGGGSSGASSFDGSVLSGNSSLLGNGSSHAFLYTGGVMTDLGTLGGNHSYSAGVSANGAVVVGNSTLVGDNFNHAFIYVAGVMTDLGTLGGDYSSASGMSANGSVVIGNASLANTHNHAFAYTGGAMVDLGTLGGDQSWSTGVSADGRVVIGNSYLAGNNNSHAFAYTNGVMTDLGTLGGTYSSVTSISADGTVIIGSSSTVANNYNHAFVYAGGVMTDLGTLGGNSSYANAISADGSVVVGNSTLAGDNSNHAFIYAGGVMTDVSLLLLSAFPTLDYSDFFGVSADGSVSAGYWHDAIGYHGFYYTNGTVTDIGGLGGNFTYAAGVSGDGSTVFGNSNLSTGEQRAVTLTLALAPPPTITTTITAADTRVTGGNVLQFHGGTLGPVGSGMLTLTNGITVLAASTGTLDATNQDIASTGAVSIGGTSLTLTGSATSVIALSGSISGDGILINAAGNNAISGANTSGGLSVTGGSLSIASANSLAPANNTVSSGGTMILPSNLVFSGAITIAGNGAAGQTGALVLAAPTGGYATSSFTTLLSDDAKIALNGDGQHYHAGTINATVAGKTLTIDTGAGMFYPDGGIGANVATVVKEGSGWLYLRANVAGSVVVNAGTYYAGVAGATGTGVIVNAGGNLLLCSDYGTPVTFTAPLTLGGTQALRLGSIAELTQSGQITLSTAATIVSQAANNYITGGIAGATSGQNLTLQVDDNTLKLAGTTAASIAQVTKTGAGVLLLDAAGVINSSSVVVSTGLLTNNGLINGGVTVSSAGTLGGSGTIAGTVTVAGTLAPGNSPGQLTQTTGDLDLLTGSHFLAQLGGTTAGNGNGYHDQYYVSNGAINIASGAILDVKSWVAADGTTTFVPARRDAFTVLRAANGIVGVFSDFTNTDYSQWLLYDNSQVAHAFGNLYGTGLAGNQTFAAYGSNATRAAIGASLWAAAVDVSDASSSSHPAGFIYAGSAAGDAAIGLLTAPDVNAYLDALSPELYLAAGDYALTVSRSITDAAWGQNSLIKVGAWTVGAGYNRAQHGYRGADAASDYELSGDTSLVTLTHDFGPHCSVGFFYGYNTGKTVAGNGRLDYRGNVFGLTSVGRFDGKRPVTLKAALVATDLRFDAVRNGAVAHDQALRSLSGQLTASVEVYREGRLSCTPLLGFVQGRSTSAAFAEAGSGALLNVESTERHSARALAGIGFGYILSNDLTLDATFAYEHEFADAPAVVTATFADARETLPMSIGRATLDRGTTSASLGAAWKIDNRVTLRLSAETRGNRELHKDYRYNAGLNVRF